MKKSLLYFAFVFVSLVFVVVWKGCTELDDNPASSSDSPSMHLKNAGSLQFSFNKMAMTTTDEDNVDTVTALLIRSGYESVQKNLAVGDGVANGTMYDVAEGKWQLFVKAKDSTGTVLYSGNTEVEIVGDQTTYVSIDLSPASSSGNLSIHN